MTRCLRAALVLAACTMSAWGAENTLREPRARAAYLPQLETLARADLADKLSVRPEDIRVVQRVPTQWTSAELECRDPTDSAATKVAGYKLYLRHRRRTYTYHTDATRVFACPAIAGR